MSIKSDLKKFEDIVNVFWDKRKSLKKDTIAQSKSEYIVFFFDSPEYYDFPKKLIGKLSVEQLDIIQEIFYNLVTNEMKYYNKFFKSKTVLRKELWTYFFQQ